MFLQANIIWHGILTELSEHLFLLPDRANFLHGSSAMTLTTDKLIELSKVKSFLQKISLNIYFHNYNQ